MYGSRLRRSKKGLKLKSENSEGEYVVLIQAIIQGKKNQNDKMNAIVRVPNDLTAGKEGELVTNYDFIFYL